MSHIVLIKSAGYKLKTFISRADWGDNDLRGHNIKLKGSQTDILSCQSQFYHHLDSFLLMLQYFRKKLLPYGLWGGRGNSYDLLGAELAVS